MTAVQPSHLIHSGITSADYHFYHAINLPGLGEIPGEWDVRDAPDEYLGNRPVTNKRVLDMGTASGFFSFYMEKKGASVVSYDVSPNDNWDIVPYASREAGTPACERGNRTRKINNAYRLSHRLLNSRAELIRGTAFAIPDLVGPVDITTFGSLLHHVGNPLFVLQLVARITRETIVLTAMLDHTRQGSMNHLFSWLGASGLRRIRHRLMGTPMISQPLVSMGQAAETGGQLTPKRLDESLRTLGFGDIRINHHRQHVARHEKPLRLYTLVANRTVPMQSV